jgi:hypothetical protein
MRIHNYQLAAADDSAVEVAPKFDNDDPEVIFACFDDIMWRAYQLSLARSGVLRA